MGEEYLEIDVPKIGSQVYFRGYKEFEKAVTRINPRLKYQWDGKEGRVLGFVHNDILHCFTIPRHFPSAEDYVKVENEGFNGDYLEWAEVKKCMEKGGYEDYRDLEKDRGDLSIEEWVGMRVIGFKGPEEVHEAERMGFLYLGPRDFTHGGKYHPTWWADFKVEEFVEFLEAKKSGLKDRAEFMQTREKSVA